MSCLKKYWLLLNVCCGITLNNKQLHDLYLFNLILFFFVSDQYIAHFPAGGSQVGWWIMENRREYFDRAKVVLNRVIMMIFSV